MSNTFDRELQQALKNVSRELAARELVQENLEKAAKLGIYAAHGAINKAAERLSMDQQKAQKTAGQLTETTKATKASRNVVTAATAAAADARNTTSAVATAAANIQVAANSLINLSADVAAILAVASSKDYGQEIQQLAQNASKLTRFAAKKAINALPEALNTSMEAAQSQAALSLTQAKNLQSGLKNLHQLLDTDYKALRARIPSDADLLTAAIAAENEQKGLYETARGEQKAMLFSEAFINDKVNTDLKYIKVGSLGEQFEVSFLPFDTVRQVLENGKWKAKNILKEYRIIFTPVDDAPDFDIHAAGATTNFVPFTPPSSSSSADPATIIEAHEPKPYVIPFSLGVRGPRAKQVAVDQTGKALKRGTPYVVFIYVEYNYPSPGEKGTMDGFLSLPSLPFTLKTDLPDARKPRLHFYQKRTKVDDDTFDTANAVRVTFSVDKLICHGVDMSELTDFRVLLFRKEDQVASAINHLADDQLNVLLKIDEAYRVAEQANVKAQQAYGTAIATNSNVAAAKKELAAAQQDYEQKQALHTAQLRVIEVLNQARASNLLLDRDTLENIPAAFGMTAKKDTSAKKATAESVKNFVAINEQGDFTDNYGAPLVTGQKYTALVFSVIKASKPAALPLFRTSVSLFSDDVTYDLPQL